MDRTLILLSSNYRVEGYKLLTNFCKKLESDVIINVFVYKSPSDLMKDWLMIQPLSLLGVVVIDEDIDILGMRELYDYVDKVSTNLIHFSYLTNTDFEDLVSIKGEGFKRAPNIESHVDLTARISASGLSSTNITSVCEIILRHKLPRYTGIMGDLLAYDEEARLLQKHNNGETHSNITMGKSKASEKDSPYSDDLVKLCMVFSSQLGNPLDIEDAMNSDKAYDLLRGTKYGSLREAMLRKGFFKQNTKINCEGFSPTEQLIISNYFNK